MTATGADAVAWSEIAQDIQEGILTWAVLTKCGIQPDLIKFGYALIINDARTPAQMAARIVVTVGHCTVIPEVDSSWVDSQNVPARMLAALTAWNALDNAARDEAIKISWASPRCAELLTQITVQNTAANTAPPVAEA